MDMRLGFFFTVHIRERYIFLDNLSTIFILTLCMLGKISADNILKYFSYQKIGFDISCKASFFGDKLHEVSDPIF